MEKILLKHTNLISMDDKRAQIEFNIDVLIGNNGKIEKIGRNIASKAKTIDCVDKYVVPGFINCHTHIPMSLFKEVVDGLPLQR